jgi:hypothetical protein
MALKFAQRIEDEDPEAVLGDLRNDWDKPNPFAGYVESQDEYFSRAFSSGTEAIDQEFATFARAITVRLREEMTETVFGKKKK